MVRDSIYNVEGQFLELQVGRCVNCGNTVDLTLLKTRQGINGEVQPKKEGGACLNPSFSSFGLGRIKTSQGV
jgi:hypothetical protein